MNLIVLKICNLALDGLDLSSDLWIELNAERSFRLTLWNHHLRHLYAKIFDNN